MANGREVQPRPLVRTVEMFQAMNTARKDSGWDSNFLTVDEQLFEMNPGSRGDMIRRRYYGHPSSGEPTMSAKDIYSEASFRRTDSGYVPMEIKRRGENPDDTMRIWVNQREVGANPHELALTYRIKSREELELHLVYFYGKLSRIIVNPFKFTERGQGIALDTRDIDHVLGDRRGDKVEVGTCTVFADENAQSITVLSHNQDSSEDSISAPTVIHPAAVVDALFDPHLLAAPDTMDTSLDRSWRGADYLRTFGATWKHKPSLRRGLLNIAYR
jgi:hypothetical protein